MSKQKELVQYFIVNTDLGMSAGKIAAQVGHAAMLIALRDQYQENFQVWREIAMKKIVLGCNEERMCKIIDENPTVIRIIDKGFTEIAPNSLTVVGFPIMTRREAYKWVHGLQTLKLDTEDMSLKEEQGYIRREAEGKLGIFYLPKLKTFTADILVNNPHSIFVLEENNTEMREEPYIEHGSIGYVIGEIMHEFDKSIVGEYYAYKIKGEHTHKHSLEGVYRDAVEYYDTFEFEEPRDEYFSKNQVNVIESIIKYQKSINNG